MMLLGLVPLAVAVFVTTPQNSPDDVCSRIAAANEPPAAMLPALQLSTRFEIEQPDVLVE